MIPGVTSTYDDLLEKIDALTSANAELVREVERLTGNNELLCQTIEYQYEEAERMREAMESCAEEVCDDYPCGIPEQGRYCDRGCGAICLALENADEIEE
jgi:hypothetical protein